MAIKLSIIIPVHNAQGHLNACLNSVLEQSLADLEVICVDDASTDGSLPILKEFAESDARLTIISIPRSGPGVARNTGLREARGAFIGFVDSDDQVHRSMFETLYDAATGHMAEMAMCFPECVDHHSGAPSASSYFARERKKLGGQELQTVYEREELTKLLPFISVVPWNKIYSRDLLRRSGATFAERLAHEDLPFFMAAFCSANRLCLVRKELYTYRVRRMDSVSHHNNPAVYHQLFEVFELIEDTILQPTKDPKLLKSYTHFKMAYLLTGINGAFRSKAMSDTERKHYFNQVKKVVEKQELTKGMSRIDQMQFLLIQNNFPGLLKLKIFLDRCKEKLTEHFQV